MSNKELMKVNQNIFTKLLIFVKSLFEKKESKIEKQEFFSLYNDVKDGNIDLYSINIEQLEKIKHMLTEEVKIKEKRLDDLKVNIKNIRGKEYAG